MSLTLTDVQRLAASVANEENSELEVLAATNAEGDSAYTEIILSVRGCRVEPCRMVIGISRSLTETEFRDTVRDRLRRHSNEHRS